MIYAYDLGVQLPISSIYNTQMMLAQVEAAKDMYEKAASEMEKFRNKYDDFYSSRPSDMLWFASEKTKLQNTIDDLYAKGKDPLRSVEGRIAMARARDSFDVALYALRKKSAAVYDEYMKNKSILDLKGLYNEEYEKWRLALEGKSLNDVVFDLYSPAAYLDEYNLTEDIFKNMKPELIRTDKEKGLDYYGVTIDRRREALNAKLDSILGTGSGRFMYDQAKSLLGPNASEELIRAAVADRILNSTSSVYDYETPKENEDAKREKDYKYSVRLHAANNASDIAKEKALRAGTPGFDAKGEATGEPTSKSRIPKEKDVLDMKGHLRNSALMVLAGTQDLEKLGKSIKPNLANIFNAAYKHYGLKEKGKDIKGKPVYDTSSLEYKSELWNGIRDRVFSSLIMSGLPKSTFPQLVGIDASTDKVDAALGVVPLSVGDLDQLQTSNDVFSHMYEGPNPRNSDGKILKISTEPIRNDIRTNIKNGCPYKLIPTGDFMPCYDENGVISIKHRVIVKSEDPLKGADYNDMWFTEKSRTNENETFKKRKDKAGTVHTYRDRYTPVTNLDPRELDINIFRASSIELDRLYGGKLDAETAVPSSSIYDSILSPIIPLTDNFFLNY